MATRLLASATFCLLAIGCANHEPQYAVQGSPGQGRAQAERAYPSQISGTTGDRVDVPPKALKTPFPDWPASWRAAGIEGAVDVTFFINEDGSVSDPAIQGSPPSTLAAITLDAIMRWKFEPAQKDGKPIRVRARQGFTFKLER